MKQKLGKIIAIFSEKVEYGISMIGFFVKGKEVVTLPESDFEKDKDGNIILPEFFQHADGYCKYKIDRISFFLSRKGQEEKYICFYPSSFISYYNLKHELCEFCDGKLIPIQN